MKKYITLLITIFYINAAMAQQTKTAASEGSSYRMLRTDKIKGVTYQLYIKGINEHIKEAELPAENPDFPIVVSDRKILMDYGSGASGEEYVLYRLNSKGKKMVELIFPKKIIDNRNKIKSEGEFKFLLTGTGGITITIKKYDYHFPSEKLVYLYSSKNGRMGFVKRTDSEIGTDHLSDDYVKLQGIAAPPNH
ncbi:hypothetical protein [Pedobacter metabolipauper]|uniref:Uncharacterized protein n=1 Tax=Pedobacter metabolipauper TaxID=425513 RepID=A0A4R6ST06_9SPHI|nr:hypothetical protein [Pedobacter metabolipauper]TDQ08076.1 hypothetical protein ATK78_2577 [Pedobacter metabolipauper]